MSTSSAVLPGDLAKKAEDLIKKQDFVNGVELILKNNLYIEDLHPKVVVGEGQRDVSSLLKDGLAGLSKNPFETLNVPLGAKTVDIRKAYKKLALKYHPDKNPQTTPLFQVIHAACEKLTDKDQRAKEEFTAQRTGAAKFRPPPQSTANSPPPRPHSSAPPTGNSNRPSHAPPPYRPTPGPGPGPRPAPQHPPGPGKYGTAPTQSSDGAFAAKYPPRQQPSRTPYSGAPHTQSHSGNGSARGTSSYADDMKREEARKQQAHEAEALRKSREAAARQYEEARRAKYQQELKANREKAQKEYHAYRRQTFDQVPSMENRNHVYSQGRYFGAAAGPTYKVSSNGNVSSQPQSAQSKFDENRSIIGKPFGFKCVSVTSTQVELEWKTNGHLSGNDDAYVELSWRNRSASGVKGWESANKLVTCSKARKKNLTPGSVYEFRVRSVDSLPGGMLGNRSDWCDAVVAVLPKVDPPAMQPNQSGSSGAAESSKSKADTTYSYSSGSNNSKDTSYSSSNRSSNSSSNKGDTSYSYSKDNSSSSAEDTSYSNSKSNDSGNGGGLASSVPSFHFQRFTGNAGSGDVPKPVIINGKAMHKSPAGKSKDDGSGMFSPASRSAWEWNSSLETERDFNVPRNTSSPGKDKRDSDGEISSEESALGEEDSHMVENEDDEEEIFEENHDFFYESPRACRATFSKAGRTTPGEVDSEDSTKYSYTDDSDTDTDVDDDDDDSDEVTWFDLNAPPSDSVLSDESSRSNSSSTGRASLYQHPVRVEPFMRSQISGYLLAGRSVLVCADCGDWLKVKVHQRLNSGQGIRDDSTNASDSSTASGKDDDEVWGWSLKVAKKHNFLTKAEVSAEGSGGVQGLRLNVEDDKDTKDTKSRLSGSNSPPVNEDDHSSKESTSPDPDQETQPRTELNPNITSPVPLKKINSVRLAPLMSPLVGEAPKAAVGKGKRKGGIRSSPTKGDFKSHSKLPDDISKDEIKAQLNKNKTRKKKTSTRNIETWYELYDDNGYVYYYNEDTKESSWEPPEWSREVDKGSGVHYYLQYKRDGKLLDEAYSQWEKPDNFSIIVRRSKS